MSFASLMEITYNYENEKAHYRYQLQRFHRSDWMKVRYEHQYKELFRDSLLV